MTPCSPVLIKTVQIRGQVDKFVYEFWLIRSVEIVFHGVIILLIVIKFANGTFVNYFNMKISIVNEGPVIKPGKWDSYEISWNIVNREPVFNE